MNELDQIRQRVFQQKPSLQRLVSLYGDMSILDYARKHYFDTASTPPLLQSRKEAFLKFIETYVESRFWTDKAEETVKSLLHNYTITTADHHGPLGHPFFFQSAILQALSQKNHTLIHLCTSHVSLGNSSYPRGLLFHWDGPLAPREYLTLPFFPAKDRICPVYQHAPYSWKNIEEYILVKIEHLKEDGYMSENQKVFIENFLLEHVTTPLVFRRQSYSEQITVMNSLWWNTLFWDNLPGLICLDAEDIVKELLIKHIYTSSSFTRLLFEEEKWSLIDTYFDGISCCFELSKKHGTYLFWYLDDENKRHALWRDGNTLKDVNSRYIIELSPSTISAHLGSGKLIPSGLLVYTILNCYYGLTCFGWFSQGTYLKLIQEAYMKMEIDEGMNDVLKNNVSNILCEDMVFSFLENWDITTALDMTYKKEHTDKEKLLLSAQNTSIKASIDSMLPEIARCL